MAEYFPIAGLACGLEFTERGVRVVTRDRRPANLLPGFGTRLAEEQERRERLGAGPTFDNLRDYES